MGGVITTLLNRIAFLYEWHQLKMGCIRVDHLTSCMQLFNGLFCFITSGVVKTGGSILISNFYQQTSKSKFRPQLRNSPDVPFSVAPTVKLLVPEKHTSIHKPTSVSHRSWTESRYKCPKKHARPAIIIIVSPYCAPKNVKRGRYLEQQFLRQSATVTRRQEKKVQLQYQ